MLSSTTIKKKEKPQMDKERPLSWSQLWLFEKNPEEWYQKYVLGKKQRETKEMKFGKEIGERIASDPTFLPEIIRYRDFEHELKCTYKHIPLIGYMDTSHLPEIKKMREFKTGKKLWDQKRVDEHGQIDMYLLMIYIIYKIKPEEMKVHLDWMPTEDATDDHKSFDEFLNGKSTVKFIEPFEPVTFETRRTMADILRFAARIEKRYKEMEEYALNHK